MDKITEILEWVENNAFLDKYCWVGFFIAAGIIIWVIWKVLTRDVA